jgi:hypothetical protein
MFLNKRFSIPHFDNCPHPSLYHELMKNASQQFRNEIYDIYFGSIFRYCYLEHEFYDDCTKHHKVMYGNVMGVEASIQQIDNLFKIQNELGIEISLTINQLNIPIEIFFSNNNRVIDAFIRWLQEFYNRGLRSCTLSNNHLMRTGTLQNKFPEMKWKNTVNQQVSTAQQVIDYLYLGYNIIQLDRSLNRNMDELRRIKTSVESFKNKHPRQYVKTCLLVWEDCMPFCPFKREHDDLQLHHKKFSYWDSHLGSLTCNRWKSPSGISTLPRGGANCFWSELNIFEEYQELVDIFKYSGRLTSKIPQNPCDSEYRWFYKNNSVKSFSEILENKLEPIHLWSPGAGDFLMFEKDFQTIKNNLKGNFWLTKQGKILSNKLKNCKSQCYNCHLCERTFGFPDIDSLIEL